MRRLILFLSVALFIACGTAANRPPDIPRPTIHVAQAGPIFFGSGTVAPMSLDVQITNRAKVPLRVREVDITSPGMSQYTLRRALKYFNETIPPGETRTLGLVAEVIASRARLQQSEPLSVRAIIAFEAEGKSFREVVLQQFAGPY